VRLMSAGVLAYMSDRKPEQGRGRR
jgi:hypothetical protein